ncbi:MAG: PDZ domain-containing protein, partial [Xanthomonadales bacterium]|nr:PDZ domain-containing protein [Xanthomonadales bacterium]
SFVTGVQTELPTQDISSSDQVAFIEAGVPGVQFFAGASPDYHKPGDTADKIDYKGLVKVAAIVREGVEYLSVRPDPMEYQGEKKITGKVAGADKPKVTKPTTGGRRVSTGIMPDFAFSGKGMSVGAVSADSPAAKAGISKGDVIIAMDGKPVSDLRSYSNLLKQYAPGDQLEFRFSRGGETQSVKLTLGSR